MAGTIDYNLCRQSDRSLLPGMKTVGGNGNTVQLSWDNAIIEWLQAGIEKDFPEETSGTNAETVN